MNKPVLDFSSYFEDVRLIRQQLDRIESSTKNFQQFAPDQEPLPLDVEGAARILGVSKQTVYSNIARIPHRKRFGRLYFFQNELLKYLDEGLDVDETQPTRKPAAQ